MLVEGMNVLGQVLEVRDMDLTLSLPGRLMATVPITNISTPYSGLLSRLARDEDVDVKSLRELFHAGQVGPGVALAAARWPAMTSLVQHGQWQTRSRTRGRSLACDDVTRSARPMANPESHSRPLVGLR